MEKRRLGPLEVSAIGLGCMGFTAAYGGQEEAESIKTLHRAIELGITFFDTAEVYGPYENEKIVGRALRGRRDKVVIATKFGFKIGTEGTGFARTTGLDSRPENVRAVAEASLQRLGIDVIDLFYQHRVDPAVPIEETVGAMAELVKAGKVRALGMSEASAATIRRAHAVHPIAAVQSEYSLWTRDPEAAVIPACRELGIGFVPYSPLGRGFLSGKIRSRADLGENDFRAGLPRFTDENLKANLALVETLKEMACARGVTAAQLALAWVLQQGESVVPIPGARKIPHLEENIRAADIKLDGGERARIAAVLEGKVQGGRYSEQILALLGQR
ncbi:MAG TPA: aldo/keto reductase [Dongiaceae bacterium]|jgi:aryl-alcohol dehydrogenase-like predicted oxidoreductase